MSDFADDASETETKERDRCIAIARQSVAAAAPLTDECLNDCGGKPRERSPYCSRECRDDAEARARQMKRSGAA